MGTKTVLTLAQFLALPEDDSVRHELDQGDLLVTPPPHHDHSRIVSDLVIILGGFVRSNRLGAVYTSETGFVLSRNPDTVRAPDVSFVRSDRVPPKHQKEYIQGAPDLAVEVVSSSESSRQVKRKIEQYFGAGCRVVWLVYPDDREVHIYEAIDRFHILKSGHVLETYLLPGFSLRLSDLLD